jgi:hypothetical protein
MTIPLWAADFSYHQNPAVLTAEKLQAMDQHGMAAAVVKLSMGYGIDTRAAQHAANVRTTSAALLGYHWVDPTNTPAAQMQYLARQVDALQPDGLAMDVEQYWRYWSQFYDAIYGRIPWSAVQKYSPAHISDHAQECQYRAQQLFGGLVLGYTGKWFIDKYAPGIAAWLASDKFWAAHHLLPKIKRLNWAQLYDRIATIPPLPYPHAWRQWTGGMVLTDLFTSDWHRLDGNIMPCWPDRAAMWAALGNTAPPPPPPPPPVLGLHQVVRCWWLAVRTAPHDKAPKVAWLSVGTERVVHEQAGAWGRIDGGWVGMAYMRRVTP